MSNKFTPTQKELSGQVEAQAEGDPAAPRVLKVEQDAAPVVQQFSFGRIGGRHTYEEVKSRYGALASSDADRQARTRKDGRFQMNPMVRERLSIEEEERRALEQKVQAQVAEIAERARAEAYEEGRRQGLEEGHAAAYQEFRGEGMQRLEQFEAMVMGFESLRQEMFKANERFLLEMVYRISRMVLLRELATDKEYVLRLARHLVERAGVRDGIRIRVNPGELETAGMLKEGLEKQLGALTNLRIEPSSQVGRGGLQLETDWNAIDASLEAQLKAVHDALTGGGEAGGA